ncbi:hypothetical protein B0T10DRAFT_579921 [Thelonectria olida]|uniref:Uncharacterized protein n=1 Tax=Thelonectria olida TaxID=1576542 RepID=A0A9P8W036_9HYPO|nr:hypothetical protein B0T10DRAFT_579921 [Thelonectria olida]
MGSTRSHHKRRFIFDGTAAQYSHFLENHIVQLTKRVAELEEALQQAGSQSAELNSPTPSNANHVLCMVFQETETPETQRAAIRASGTRTLKRRCDNAVADFLARVPTCLSQWSTTRNDTQLSTPKQIVDTFQILTLRSPDIRSRLPHSEPPKTPPVAVEAYQKLQEALRQNANYSTQLRNYSLMLFFCICQVARNCGMSVEKVDELINASLPDRNPGSIYSAKLRRGARWAASVIEKLEAELGYLASQLFVLYGPPIETYRNWAEQGETSDYLIAKIKEQAKFLKAEVPESPCVSFSPVFLITYTGPWGLDQVNKALGTKLSQLEYERRVQVVKDAEAQVKEPLARQNMLAARQRVGEPDTESPGLGSGWIDQTLDPTPSLPRVGSRPPHFSDPMEVTLPLEDQEQGIQTQDPTSMHEMNIPETFRSRPPGTGSDDTGHDVAQALLCLRGPEAPTLTSTTPDEPQISSSAVLRSNEQALSFEDFSMPEGYMADRPQSPGFYNFDTDSFTPIDLSNFINYPDDGRE